MTMGIDDKLTMQELGYDRVENRSQRMINAKHLWYKRLVAYFPDMERITTPSEVLPYGGDTEMNGSSVLVRTINGMAYLFILNKTENLAQLVPIVR